MRSTMEGDQVPTRGHRQWLGWAGGLAGRHGGGASPLSSFGENRKDGSRVEVGRHSRKGLRSEQIMFKSEGGAYLIQERVQKGSNSDYCWKNVLRLDCGPPVVH